jgi:hypothetical protein
MDGHPGGFLAHQAANLLMTGGVQAADAMACHRVLPDFAWFEAAKGQ